MGGKSLFGCCVPRKRKKTSSRKEPTDAASVPLVSDKKNQLANRVSTDEHVTVQAAINNKTQSNPSLAEASSLQQNDKSSLEVSNKQPNDKPVSQSKRSSTSSDSSSSTIKEDYIDSTSKTEEVLLLNQNEIDKTEHLPSVAETKPLSSQAPDKKSSVYVELSQDQPKFSQKSTETSVETYSSSSVEEKSVDDKNAESKDASLKPKEGNELSETSSSAGVEAITEVQSSSSSSSSDESFEILDDTILHKKSSISDAEKDDNESAQKTSILAAEQLNIEVVDGSDETVEEAPNETQLEVISTITAVKVESQESSSVQTSHAFEKSYTVDTVSEETVSEKSPISSAKKTSLSSFGSSQTEEFFDASNNSEVYFSADSAPGSYDQNPINGDDNIEAKTKEESDNETQKNAVENVSVKREIFKQESFITADDEVEIQRRASSSSSSSSDNDTLNSSNIPNVEDEIAEKQNETIELNDVSSYRNNNESDVKEDEDDSSSDTLEEQIDTTQNENTTVTKSDDVADDSASLSSSSSESENCNMINEESVNISQTTQIVDLIVSEQPIEESREEGKTMNSKESEKSLENVTKELGEAEEEKEDKKDEANKTDVTQTEDIVEQITPPSVIEKIFSKEDDAIKQESAEDLKVNNKPDVTIGDEPDGLLDQDEDADAGKRRVSSSSSSSSSSSNSDEKIIINEQILPEESTITNQSAPAETENDEDLVTDPPANKEEKEAKPKKKRENITFKSGWRRVVQLVDLINARLVTEGTAKELELGTIDEGQVAQDLQQYLSGMEPIAGLLITDTGKKMSLYDASKNRLLLRGTVVSLLEAQAATGSIINPYNGEKMNVEEATKTGLIDKFLASVLVRAERAAFGFNSRLSATPLSLFEAMKRNLVVESHGIRLLEAQIATGGIIDPRANHRIPVDVAFERGLFDERLNAILEDPSDDTKGFFDPNTNQNLTYLQLMERCVVDEETSLKLLPLYKKKQKKDYWKKDL